MQLSAVVLLVAALLVSAQESKPLTPVQQQAARVLQLEADNSQLRQAVVSLQVQVEACRGPQDAQAREQRWKQLEQEAGCPIDRNVGACKAAPKQ